MKTYHYSKKGTRIPPRIEGELDFFIPVGIILLETEECSNEKNGSSLQIVDYEKEVKI
jgi:hypothetical protein